MPRGITKSKPVDRGGFEFWMCSCGFELQDKSQDKKRAKLIQKLHAKKCSGEKKYTIDEMKARNLQKTHQKKSAICGVDGGARNIVSFGESDGVKREPEKFFNLKEFEKSLEEEQKKFEKEKEEIKNK
tara:strand:+ start:1371 stop:1754 length:384 start_codon:yes stop_codon:yes gene_type:complete